MNEQNTILNEILDGFWTRLEFKLSNDLNKSDIPELKGFWCDGIFLPSSDYQLKQKFVNNNRQIQLVAWLGKTGQEEYKALIHFGKKAQSRYARGLSLEACIPIDDRNWFEIDVKKKFINIYLV